MSQAIATEAVFLSSLQINNSYNGLNYRGFLKDFNGTIWDNSKLYENRNYLEIKGVVSLDYLKSGVVHSIHSSFDIGKHSEALHARPADCYSGVIKPKHLSDGVKQKDLRDAVKAAFNAMLNSPKPLRQALNGVSPSKFGLR